MKANEKKEWRQAEVEVIKIDNNDIIVTSGETESTGDIELPIVE